MPLDQLPIQEVLRFDPPSADIAVPYLQLVALAEGHALSKSSVEQLYSSTGCLNAGADSLLPPSSDGPLHPKIELCTTERKSSLGPTLGATYDLRCAINHLHYWCQWAVGASRDPLGLLPAARERWHSTGNDTTESVWSQDSLQGSGLTDLSPVTILGESSGRSTSDRLSGLEQLSWQLCSAYAADEGSVDAQDHVRLRSEMQALARFTDALSFSDSALCQPFERACEVRFRLPRFKPSILRTDSCDPSLLPDARARSLRSQRQRSADARQDPTLQTVVPSRRACSTLLWPRRRVRFRCHACSPWNFASVACWQTGQGAKTGSCYLGLQHSAVSSILWECCGVFRERLS